MSMPVRIDDERYEEAKAALDYPDLPLEFARELLLAKAKKRSQLTSFKPGQLRG